MGGWMGGWMDRWMDGWMDGWLEGWVDEQMDGHQGLGLFFPPDATRTQARVLHWL